MAVSDHQATAASPGGDVLVVGAGIVGTCSALYLQREGFRVTLVERDGPGEACSAGNAGNLGVASCVPYSLPGLFWRVPRLLLDPREALAVRWTHFPRAFPWFIRFLRSGSPERVEEIADALRSLMSRLFDAYDPLVAAAGAEELIERRGRLVVYETDDWRDRGRYAMDIRRRRGIEVRELEGDQVREIEPALGPAIKGGYFIPEGGHCVNPTRLVQKFAESFVRNGGTLLRETVKGFEVDSGGPLRVRTDSGAREVDAVVIAAGAWSAPLAAQLGTKVPLQAERGYNVMLPNPGVSVRMPISLPGRNAAVTQMEHGLRVTGIAEFAAVDAPPRYVLADRVLRYVQGLIPGLNTEGLTRWMGPRPSTPDSMPVIGRSPHHPKVFFAFGHGHVGLGTGAITGRLIGQLVAGRAPEVDLTPFRPDRF